MGQSYSGNPYLMPPPPMGTVSAPVPAPTLSPPTLYPIPATLSGPLDLTTTYATQLTGVQGQLMNSVETRIYPSPWAPDRVFQNDYNTYTTGVLPYLCNVVYGTSGFSSADAAQQWIGTIKNQFQTNLPVLGYSGVNVVTSNSTYENKYQNITYNSVTFNMTCTTSSGQSSEMLWTLY